MFEKNLNIAFLLDFYGEVLSTRTKELLEMYYCDDLSLAEIAEQIGISRQGARQAIKKGEEELLFLEEKLGLAARHREMEKQTKQILHFADVFDRARTNENADALLQAIRMMDHERED